jgi:hypothetical protein
MDAAPPGYQIVNFLGRQFLEPLDADEYGIGKDTARMRFSENINMIDYKAL